MKTLLHTLLICCLTFSAYHSEAQYDFHFTKQLFELKTDAEVEAFYENHFKAEVKDSNLVHTYMLHSYDVKEGIKGYNEEIRTELFEMRDQIQEYGFRYEQLFFSEITLEEDSVTSVSYKQRFANENGYLEILFEPVFRTENDWYSYSGFNVYYNDREMDLSELEYIQLNIDTSGMVAYKNRLMTILESENKEGFDAEILREQHILNNTNIPEEIKEKLLRNQEMLHQLKDNYFRTIKAVHSYSMCDQLQSRYFWQSHAKINYRMIMLEHLQENEYGQINQLANVAAFDMGKGFKIVNFDD